jgi:uncharacterized protein (DUF486 family)
MQAAQTLALLFMSNLFMTYAWYGHLKDFKERALAFVIALSWGVAFFEYCFQVPANRIGADVFTLPQLKVIQEVLSLAVFALFYALYWKGKLSWNFAAAGLCLVAAVFFMFRDFNAPV